MISLCRLGHTPGGGTWGCLGSFFSKHGRVAFQIEGDGKQNGIQVISSPYGQTCELETEAICQLSLNFFESVGCLRYF